MNYWLMKSEPTTFSIDTLMQSPKQTTHWEGVRNYQARNMMRDQMRVGDQAFFYHSNCEEPGIVGIVEIVKEAYPDLTALNPESHYYDPKATNENPRWVMVDVRFVKKFGRTIPLHLLKQQANLSELAVTRKGSRLSITPVSKDEWNTILSYTQSN